MISPVDRSTVIVAVGLAAVITGAAFFLRKLFVDAVSVPGPELTLGDSIEVDGIPYTITDANRYYGFFNGEPYKTQWWYYLVEAGETEGRWYPEKYLLATV